ncbi:ribonuclease E/G [Lachnospira multipara]|uniref:ribonuclease E/G n=1 Tax=Lachnospira multipara TaxID=28051 RepID=UPI0003F82A5A|nr:ribonuclease E/G [Lachnospira multipara]
MSTKLIITSYNNKLISAKYVDDEIKSLTVCDNEHNISDIFIGRVENVVKSINACFIEFSNKQKGYYAFSENKDHIFLNNKNNDLPNIGDKILVQVKNPPHKTKPHTLSSKLEIPYKYLVLSRDVNGVLVSKKIKNDENVSNWAASLAYELKLMNEELVRELGADFKDTRSKLSYGFIIRSNAVNANLTELMDEAKHLHNTYKEILKIAIHGLFYTKVYESLPSYITEVNHLVAEEDFELVTDNKEAFSLIKNNCNLSDTRLRFYEDRLLPLYSLYSIKHNIDEALRRQVWLKSGAYLVIEETEALTVVDVNSGKFVPKKGKDKDLSNYNVNIEAARATLTQLRLRNISGIIIVDFINMKDESLNEDLLKYLKKEAKDDEVGVRIVDMTKLGLVEITRTKQGQTLKERMGLERNEELRD